MNDTDNEDRALRKALVTTAEAVMKDTFKNVNRGRLDDRWKVEKAQLSQLIGVCGEAACAEEIENYLRYQASRERPSWGIELVDRVIGEVNKVAGTNLDDVARVGAWRLYAVYLARSFTYHRATTLGRERS